MSDDTEKEGVVIDVTPEADEPDTAQPQAARPHPDRLARAPLVVALLALLLVVAALVAGYLHGRQVSSELASIQQRLGQGLTEQAQLREQLAAANQAVQQQAQSITQQNAALHKQQQLIAAAQQRFAAQDQSLEQARQAIQEREAKLLASVADVRKRMGASGTHWMVAEADYLLRLANTRLNLARDVATARSALQLADQRLADTGDPGWTQVRNQIAQELAALAAVKVPDVTGLAAQLSALIGEVPQLHLSNTVLGGPEQRTPGYAAISSTAHTRSWHTLLDDLWAGFRDTIRIRRNSRPMQAMLPPDQQYFLYQNLRLMLDSARLALVRGDQSLYSDSLTTVQQWLGSYFDPADARTQAMRSEVEALAKVDVHPALPDISQSLRSLHTQEHLNGQSEAGQAGSGTGQQQ